MPPLTNPKHEMVAREYVALLEDQTQKPSLTNAYKKVYGSSHEVADAHAYRVGNGGVKNRIQEILEEQLGLTDDYLLRFGREKFLDGEDQNIAHKAWRTFLEIKGIVGNEAGINIAQVIFSERIVSAIPQDMVSTPSTSDNQAQAHTQIET